MSPTGQGSHGTIASPTDPALTGDPAEVHLLRFMLSGSASSYQSWAIDVVSRMFLRLGIPAPLAFLSHHTLRIHGNYYELCRRDPQHQRPFRGMANFEMIPADSELFRRLETKPKWLGEDILLGTTTLTPRGIYEKVDNYESSLDTEYTRYHNSLKYPREYSLLNSNCQHFVIDFCLCIEVDFGESALAWAWFSSRLPQLIAGPVLALALLFISFLASIASTYWSRVVFYAIGALYYTMYKLIIAQDLLAAASRKQRLRNELLYWQSEHAQYVYQQYQKLSRRHLLGSLQQPVYGWIMGWSALCMPIVCWQHHLISQFGFWIPIISMTVGNGLFNELCILLLCTLKPLTREYFGWRWRQSRKLIRLSTRHCCMRHHWKAVTFVYIFWTWDDLEVVKTIDYLESLDEEQANYQAPTRPCGPCHERPAKIREKTDNEEEEAKKRIAIGIWEKDQTKSTLVETFGIQYLFG